jgi:hypothetical protein
VIRAKSVLRAEIASHLIDWGHPSGAKRSLAFASQHSAHVNGNALAIAPPDDML